MYGLLVLLPCISQAQKQGNYWKLGRNAGITFNNGNGQVAVGDTCSQGLSYSSSTVCDNRGNLLFYSEGKKVYNRLDRIMPNGNNFNTGTAGNLYSYLPIHNGLTFVPFVNDTNKYYLFYENLEFFETNGPDYLPNRLQYLVIDKTLNVGLGDVVYKDSCIVCGADSLAKGNIFSIRHGNGKDWWLLARKYHSNLFYKILIDSSGVHKVDTQSIGKPHLGIGYFSGIYSVSYQGNKLAYLFAPLDTMLKDGRLDVFDFDRCTGKLSNPIHEHMVLDGDSFDLASLCFSPNGRYLYATEGYIIYQMDMQAPNILASAIKIARSDNSLSPSPSVFYQMKRGPDGKIYVSFYGGNYYMSVINNPDNAGAACNFVYKQIYFGGMVGSKIYVADGALPNNPNYALGKIDCGVGMGEQLAVGSGQLAVYPNPCGEKLTVSGYQLLVNTIEVTDVLGRVLLRDEASNQQINNSSTQQIQLDVSSLPQGIYFIKATDSNGNLMNGKFVKE
ncbi:MAG: hypothetical protein RIQ33_1057 [Bacteroidota bacterium]